jgi:hypothetical protein
MVAPGLGFQGGTAAFRGAAGGGPGLAPLARSPDHLGQFLGFISNLLTEVSGRAGKHRATRTAYLTLSSGWQGPNLTTLRLAKMGGLQCRTGDRRTTVQIAIGACCVFSIGEKFYFTLSL